jgi:hypothetical protein
MPSVEMYRQYHGHWLAGDSAAAGAAFRHVQAEPRAKHGAQSESAFSWRQQEMLLGYDHPAVCRCVSRSCIASILVSLHRLYLAVNMKSHSQRVLESSGKTYTSGVACGR